MCSHSNSSCCDQRITGYCNISNTIWISHIIHRCFMSQVRNAHIFTKDECPPQNISIQVCTKSIFYAIFSVISICMNHFHFKVKQEHYEDCNSNYNETAYNELFEMTNSSLQSCYPNGDNEYDLNTYSYNHLHEKPLYMITDAYAVVEPMIRPPASLDECRVWFANS